MADVLAIYPGTFDPVTQGHVDIIERGSRIFDRVTVAILRNPQKKPLFTAEERVEMIRATFPGNPYIVIDTFDGLLVDYARQQRATVIVRGLRVVSDFEYEFQMTLMNRQLADDIETVFMMPKEAYTYVSSHLVKEVVCLGGTVKRLVPPIVEERLRLKFSPSDEQKETARTS